MIWQILSHTPPWVFALFAGLVVLGITQMRTRTATLRRVTIMPVVMVGMAVWGVIGALGHSPVGPAVLLVWLLGAAISIALSSTRPLPSGTRYDTKQQLFTLPGSIVPMLLILAIFSTKYAVGATLGMHPEMAQQTSFALTVSGIYGLISGIFAARTLRLWRLSKASDTPLQTA